MDHLNDVENIDFESEFEFLLIADIEDADTMLEQHEKVPEQMSLSDDGQLDEVFVPLPPQPQPMEGTKQVNHGLTYIWNMLNLDVLQKIIQAERQPRAQQNNNGEQNHRTDDGTQDDKEEIFTLEDILNHKIMKDRKTDKTVGVKIHDVSETTTSIKETKLSDNSILSKSKTPPGLVLM